MLYMTVWAIKQGICVDNFAYGSAERNIGVKHLPIYTKEKDAMYQVKKNNSDSLQFYNFARSFLESHLPVEMSAEELEEYFKADNDNFKSIGDVFARFIESAQNYQGAPNSINLKERKDGIRKILFNYDVSRVVKEYDADSLDQEFRSRFKLGPSNKKSYWYRWSHSIIDSAKFLIKFNDANEFREFVMSFNSNANTRMALSLLISERINGFGFALACDALKELGFYEYCKPDTHLVDIFSKAGICECNKLDVFETVSKISERCCEAGESVTPYKIDKILWLISSGRYYRHDSIDDVKSLKNEFIEELKSQKNKWNFSEPRFY